MGYTLRLQWLTKYERPREPARPEPTNFDQLVSAVTQSIVPGTQAQSPVGETRASLKAERSSSGEPTATVATTDRRSVPSPRSSSDKPSRSPQMMPRSVMSAPPMASLFTPTQLDPVSLSLLADATHPDYSSSVELSTSKGFVDYDSIGIWRFATGQLAKQCPRTREPGDPRRNGDVWGCRRAGSIAEGEGSDHCWCAAEPVGISAGANRTASTATGTAARRHTLVPHPALVQVGFWLLVRLRQSNEPLSPTQRIPLALVHGRLLSPAEHGRGLPSRTFPHIKEVSRSTPRLAAQAITYELQAFRATSKTPMSFPGGLVLSLLCMSSSICWTDQRQFGLQFLKPGRAVLNCLNKFAGYLSSSTSSTAASYMRRCCAA